MRVVLDDAARGSVVRLTTAAGVTIADERGNVPLFEIVMTRPDNLSTTVVNSAESALTCAVEPQGNGVMLRYSGFAEGLEAVICTVRPDGDRIRWNIGAAPKSGWAVERTIFPQIKVSPIGARSDDDAFVSGHAKGGLYRNPTELDWLKFSDLTSPGLLAVQMCCYYDPDALLYFAAEDGHGDVKSLDVKGGDGGVRMAFSRRGFDAKAFRLGYDVVMAAIDRRGGDPLTWHDAADLYRRWAECQSWCGEKYRNRKDIPAWLKDAPAMVRVRRDWLRNPDDIRAWVNDYFRRQFPNVPLIMDYFGWERYGMWCSAYFPPYPDEGSFRCLVKDMRATDAHAFLWPSGYHFTLAYGKRDDGGWVYDGRSDYEALGGDVLAVGNRDGKPQFDAPKGCWLQGGNMMTLCGGLEKVRRWWTDDICRPIAGLGVELIQADQIYGGGFPPCWNPAHGHPLGDGLWKTDCMRLQLSQMAEATRAVEPEGVITFEEANELFNDQIGLQLGRGDESNGHEWANPYTYVYHEWMQVFFEYPMRDNLITTAYAAAEGLMPHFAMARSDLGETRDGYDRFMSNWVRFYHGEARDFLAYGRELKPPRAEVSRRLCERPVASSSSPNGIFKIRRMRPDVFHSRWQAEDGRKALVFVNSCDGTRSITVRENGRIARYELEAYELKLVIE